MKMKCGDYSSTTIPPSSDRATIGMSKNPNRPKQNSARLSLTYSAAYFSLEFPGGPELGVILNAELSLAGFKLMNHLCRSM
jgi:hypothetical protein